MFYILQVQANKLHIQNWGGYWSSNYEYEGKLEERGSLQDIYIYYEEHDQDQVMLYEIQTETTQINRKY